MEFLNVNILWNLIWILPLFLILAIIASKKREKYLAMILGKRHSDSEHVNLSKNKRAFRLWVLAIIIVFITIAAARPYWGYRLLPFSGSGRDILAVIDVSKSMLSKDIRPSRLAHAKLLLKNLIKNTPEDRYGIIAFAGSAFLECPLTIDRTSLYTVLKDINIDSIPVGSTNIEKALNTAIKAFKAAAGGYKAIILITDGDELLGDSSNVINTLNEIKTPLLIVGIGDPSKPGLIQLSAKDGKSEFLRDSKGNLVKSKLNETKLKQLAQATNGIYIRSTAVDPGLNILKKKISQLIPEKYENGKMTRPLEKFQFPLLLALLFVFIWLATGERRKKGNNAINNKQKKSKRNKHLKAIIILLSVIIISPSYIQADSNNATNIQLPENLPVTAPKTQIKTPMPATDQTPQKQKTSIEMFNIGVDAQANGKIQEAKKHYTESINLANKKGHLRSKAYQNMGVIQHSAARKIMEKNPEQSLQELAKAENLYKEAMRRGPLRKEVAVNQQILLNDKKKAEEIIKRRKEMQKKREEAREKTQEALNKQQQSNEDKQEKKQENKEQQKTKQNKQQQKKQEANDKTKQAQKAVEDYKKSAKQNNSKKDTQAAQGASDDLKNAQKNQQQNNNQKAEESLKEALKKLSGDGQQKQQQNNQKNKQNDNQQQKKKQNKEQQKKQMQDKKNQAQQKTQDALDKQQQANKSQGKEKGEKQKEANQKTKEAKKANDDYQKSAKQNNSQQDKQNAGKAAQNLKEAQQNQSKNDGKKAEDKLKKALDNLKKDKSDKPEKLPQQPKNQPAQPRQDNKEIDPKQADALLKLMAKDEKSLKEELKKRQKDAYGNMSVDKDW